MMNALFRLFFSLVGNDSDIMMQWQDKEVAEALVRKALGQVRRVDPVPLSTVVFCGSGKWHGSRRSWPSGRRLPREEAASMSGIQRRLIRRLTSDPVRV